MAIYRIAVSATERAFGPMPLEQAIKSLRATIRKDGVKGQMKNKERNVKDWDYMRKYRESQRALEWKGFFRDQVMIELIR